MTSPPPDTIMHRPLTGVRVLDLMRLLPGPATTCHLVNLGTEVIKIEDPDPDDYVRDVTRTFADRTAERLSLFFRSLNRDGAEMRPDLKRAEDRDALTEPTRHAGVLIESFRPGVMMCLGVGRDILHTASPALVMCSINGYGQGGPLTKAADHGINCIGYASMFGQLANADGTSIVPNVQIGDLLGSAFTMVVDTLAVLVDTRATGHNHYVDISMTDSVFTHNLMASFAAGTRGKASPAGTDPLSGGVSCYGVYRMADDRLMAVGASELEFQQAMCDVVDKPTRKGSHWSLGQHVGGEEARAIRDELTTLFRTATQVE